MPPYCIKCMTFHPFGRARCVGIVVLEKPQPRPEIAA